MNAGSHLTTVGIDSGSRIWADVGERLEAFAKAWDAGDRFPEIREFLPDDSFPARTLILSELIKLDIERRIQRNIDRPLEDYVRDFPVLADDGPPTDLVYEDFHLRRQAGRPVDLDDYFRRFPRGADDLGRLLNHGPQTQSTSVVSAAPHVQFEPGAQLDDFDLLALLGEGQFARVFLARQRSMQRMVALKVSAARGTEAQTLAQLDHPHIVRVFDQRFLPDHHVQLVYMSYLPGGTLQQVVVQARATSTKERSGQTLLEAVDAALHARGEVPPPASAVRKDWSARSWPAAVCVLGVKLAGALDYAHRQGVLHRDVKPANILLTPEGEPLLADFNIGSCSKLDGAGPSAVFGGSLPYMSPEHLEAFNPAHSREPESLDGRADIFSLAVTLWELLAGERPFTQDLRGSSWTEMLNELVEIRRMGPTVAERASIADGDVPGLREVLLRCLDPDVERRPATAAEMASELGLCLRPATRALVRPKPGGWRAVVRQYPYWTLIVAGVIPNALASIFNIVYNRAEIVRQWGNGNKAEQVFYSIIPLLNGIFFPLGVLTVFLLMRPLASALRQVRWATLWEKKYAIALDDVRCESARLALWSAWRAGASPDSPGPLL